MQAAEEKDYTKKLDFSLWRKLLRESRGHWKDLFWLAVTMAVVAGIDVIFPLLTAWAIDHPIAEGTTAGVGKLVAVYLALMAVQAVTCWGFQIFAMRAENGVCYDIRKKAFRRLQELPFSYYDKMPVGFIMSRMTSDCQRLGETIGWSLCDIAYSLVMLIAASVAMFSLNAALTWQVLVVVPPLAVISWFFQQKILRAHREVRKNNSKITGAFNEGIMGAKTTKTLVREDANTREFNVLTRDMHVSSMRAATLSSLYLPLVISLGSVATAWALRQGGVSVLGGVMTIGTLQVFVNYTVQFFEPIRSLAEIISEFQSTQAAAERVITLLETEPEIADTPEVTAVFGDEFHPKRENWPRIEGGIRFEHVDFRYAGGDEVLSDFCLDVKPGETIALVGPTGAGKSTVVNLACRFYEPTGGRILIDGVDYKERSLLWLESNLGYVLQEPRLFSGTIRENIRYGRLDATDEEICEAARLVNAESFILMKDKGYDTDVGEGGSLLSTGEKQLISFARAILANPRIFVLDEATSSVDTHTEQMIQHAITRVLEGRTSFIIAHRLSTVRTADRILVIENGRIAEEGNHETLMAARGKYWHLYTNQFAEENTMEALGAGEAESRDQGTGNRE